MKVLQAHYLCYVFIFLLFCDVRVLIFFLGGIAASYVPLGFVVFED